MTTLSRITSRVLQAVARRIGVDAHITGAPTADMGEDFAAIYQRCRKYTQTSVHRMHALYEAVLYIERAAVPGDIVECGVWKGGSSMLAASTLLRTNSRERSLWLYDTYEGMSAPTDRDRDRNGALASDMMASSGKDGDIWCYASLETVRRNMATVGYPETKLQFVRGKVEDTIPGILPKQIALLRLDTDFFESTYHEFTHLYPLLAPRGVLIVDDYGHWQGAREATDRYFQECAQPILLNRIDDTGRIGIKPGGSSTRAE